MRKIKAIHELYDPARPITPPFRLADDFETTSISFSNTMLVPLLHPLLDALKYSVSVNTLELTPMGWPKEDVHALVECLAVNKGITTLKISYWSPTLLFMEGLVKILKINTTIKRLEFQGSAIKPPVWERFCDGLEYYSIKILALCFVGLTDDDTKLFFDNLKYNQSIKELWFTNESMFGSLATFCKMLATNNSIEHLFFQNCLSAINADLGELNVVLKENFLKRLSLPQSLHHGNSLNKIADALKVNTSIMELSLTGNYLDPAIIGEIMATNRTIKKLDLSNTRPLTHLQLGSNPVVEEISFAYCYELCTSEIVRELSTTKSIKVLRIGLNPVDNIGVLEKFLAESTTLQELACTYYAPYLPSCVRAIGAALRVNKSLRKLTFGFEELSVIDLKEFLDALKENKTLTELNIGYLSRLAKDRPSLDVDSGESLILDVLKTNTTLRHIESAENLPQLKKNREIQDKIITDTCTMISLILAKPTSFILPVEIWEMIYRHVTYDFISLDLVQKFFNNNKTT